ncbi:hypothetical protein BBW65_04470 [Helicobacter enhydrae]|uniref:Uncharacterized protein n=1 Tax=Helicobacter enhydrae TaxID=222136 RepID=A0A1B1U5S2_9HELI|nr:hypothetical protein [Helicobacter enhydrae]ANV98100.1 hypothetical protein BBW65_04470 [Helicobacter enhydrae]
MKNSNAFFALPILALLFLIVWGIYSNYLSLGHNVALKTFLHINNQMQRYEQSLFDIVAKCLKNDTYKQCKQLSFQLKGGYRGVVVVKELASDLLKIDVMIEYGHPLSAQYIRHFKTQFLEKLK